MRKWCFLNSGMTSASSGTARAPLKQTTMENGDQRPAKLPKLTLGTVAADKSSSDLLSRVSQFLPQIKTANDQLFSKLGDDSLSRTQIDAELVRDEVEEDGGDAVVEQYKNVTISSATTSIASSSSAGSQKDPTVEVAGPTIQLKIAMGELDENRAIALLAGQEEEEEIQDRNNEGGFLDDDAQDKSGKVGAIRSLLIKDKSRKSKGPLITEVDPN